MEEREERPNRRERERNRHRQEILGAAQRVVDARGIDGVTIDEVAREAEFAVGSIYKHFKSKDELVSVLVVAQVDRYLDELDALLAGPAPFPELLDAVARLTYGRHQRSRPLLMAWMGLPGAPTTPLSDELLADRRARGRALFDALIARGQAEGALAPGERRLLSIAFVGMLLSFSKASLFAERPLEGDLPGLAVRIFLHGAGHPVAAAS